MSFSIGFTSSKGPKFTFSEGLCLIPSSIFRFLPEIVKTSLQPIGIPTEECIPPERQQQIIGGL